MAMALLGHQLDRPRLEKLSDGLATAAVVCLPWSTTFTGIFLTLWLLSLLPVHDFPGLRRILKTPAGALPIALLGFAALGMLWADVSWTERLHGVNAMLKLLFIPLLMTRFSRSSRAHWALNGLLGSVTVLLLVSTLHWFFWPTRLFNSEYPGIPVHDYITQSAFFMVAIFVLLERAKVAWREGRVWHCVAFGILAVLFLTSILSIATGRTAFAVIPVLLVLFALRQASIRAGIALCLAGVLLVGTAWAVFPYFGQRVASIMDEIRRYEVDTEFTSAGFRLEFIKNSVQIIGEAPMIGHGTGMIRQSFVRAIEKGQSRLPIPTVNPHNQILAIAIQFGLTGTALLFAMWIAHLWLFRGPTFLAWAGLVVTAQNVVSSLFNSHLFDFTMGWFYVIMVGVLAGAVMRERESRAV